MTNNITEAVENMLDTLENLTRKQKADENEELDMINSPAHCH